MAEAPDGVVNDRATPLTLPLQLRPEPIIVSPPAGQAGWPWELVGGEEAAASLRLHLLVGHPTERGVAARVVVEIPLVASDGCLSVGAPSAWQE